MYDPNENEVFSHLAVRVVIDKFINCYFGRASPNFLEVVSFRLVNFLALHCSTVHFGNVWLCVMTLIAINEVVIESYTGRSRRKFNNFFCSGV
jgi:hypothetical protein